MIIWIASNGHLKETEWGEVSAAASAGEGREVTREEGGLSNSACLKRATGGRRDDALARADTTTDAKVLRDERCLVRGENLNTQLAHLDDRA